MTVKPINEPAFPVTSEIIGHWSGMTLRDYFAAQAMQGMCSTPQWPMSKEMIEIAKRAYFQADAMLHERAKEQQ